MTWRASGERGSSRGQSSSAIAHRRRHRRAIALLSRTIIGPEHAGCGPAPWAPSFGERPHLFRARARFEREQEPRRLLQGEIAGGPGVRMTETEQQIDVGGPGADAVNGRPPPLCPVPPPLAPPPPTHLP